MTDKDYQEKLEMTLDLMTYRLGCALADGNESLYRNTERVISKLMSRLYNIYRGGEQTCLEFILAPQPSKLTLA